MTNPEDFLPVVHSFSDFRIQPGVSELLNLGIARNKRWKTITDPDEFVTPHLVHSFPYFRFHPGKRKCLNFGITRNDKIAKGVFEHTPK